MSSKQATSFMAIRSIVPYYGGKRALAASIVEELGPHVAYFEPFCGGLSVLLAKPRSAQETVVDLNGQLANLALVLADPKLASRLYRELRRVPACEAIYLQSCLQLEDDQAHGVMADWGSGIPIKACPSYVSARSYFIASWLGRNGLVGSVRRGCTFCVRYTPGGGSTATRFRHVVDSIPAFRRRLRDVTILCRDAFEVVGSIDDCDGMVIYCDPPYLAKSKPYLHDFADADHKRLADALSRFKRARVLVSYYDHPALDSLYPGWTKRSFIRHKNLSNQGQYGSNGTKCTEVLLINGPSLVAESRPLLEIAP